MRIYDDLQEYISIYADTLAFTVHDPSKFINLFQDKYGYTSMFREIPLDKFKYPMENGRDTRARCVRID